MPESVPDEQAMIDAARQILAYAHAPYSGFRVASAIRTTDGRVFTGVNVENASYGLTQCAERSAVCSAIGAGATAIDLVVVYTPTPTPTAPCGACRQVIREFAHHTRILCVCDSEQRLDTSIDHLLPAAFHLDP